MAAPEPRERDHVPGNRGLIAMPASPEERAALYRNYAAFLRRLAGRTRVETAGAQLRHLAVEFDRLAVSIHRATLAA